MASPMVSPIGSPDVIPSYDSDLYSIQQINLSRGTTIRRPPSVSSEHKSVISTNNPASTATPTATSTNQPANERYSNIDRLLTSPSPSGSNSSDTFETNSSASNSHTHALFKKDYSINTVGPNEPPNYDDIIKE